MLEQLRIDEKTFEVNCKILTNKLLECNDKDERYRLTQELNAANIQLYTCQFKINQLESNLPILGFELPVETQKPDTKNKKQV